MAGENIRDYVLANIKSSTQFRIVAICLMIAIVDGFDILSIVIVAPMIAREWGLDPIELGIVLSSGLAGMCIGAFALSPLGDILGRRTAIMVNLAVIGGGMLLTVTARDISMLAAFRFLSGLGIGAMISSTGTIIMEYVPRPRQTSALGLMIIGNPIGNLSSGVVALLVMGIGGWQAVFFCGGILTLAMIPVVWFGMPESVEYVLKRRPADALNRLNKTLQQIRLAPVAHLPNSENVHRLRSSARDLYRGKLMRRTILISAIQFIFMFAYYMFANWSPKLVTDFAGSDDAGVLVAMMTNVGGIAGTLMVGLVAAKLGLRKTTAFSFIGLAICYVWFGTAPESLSLLNGVALITGFLIFATMVPLFALVAGSYPAEVRATAVGLTFAIGRIGSVLGPAVAGVLLYWGMDRSGLLVVTGLPLLVAALLVLRIPRERSELTNS